MIVQQPAPRWLHGPPKARTMSSAYRRRSTHGICTSALKHQVRILLGLHANPFASCSFTNLTTAQAPPWQDWTPHRMHSAVAMPNRGQEVGHGCGVGELRLPGRRLTQLTEICLPLDSAVLAHQVKPIHLVLTTLIVCRQIDRQQLTRLDICSPDKVGRPIWMSSTCSQVESK